MSADTATNAEISRATRNIIKGAGARLAGRSRGPDRRVRRNSYDVDDSRARVWVKIHSGQKQAGLRWCDTLRKVARELDQCGAKRGRGAPLGPYTRCVLDALLDLVDFRTGRLDPTYEKLMAMTGFSKSLIASALRRLQLHGFVDWVRRSHLVDKGEEVAREQTSNAYFFDLGRMQRAVQLRFRQLLDRRDRTAGANPPQTSAPRADRRDAILTPKDPELAAALASLGARYASGAE